MDSQKDKTNIENARYEFSLKEFAKTLAIYKTIAPELLNDLDVKIIEPCKTYIDLYKKTDPTLSADT